MFQIFQRGGGVFLEDQRIKIAVLWSVFEFCVITFTLILSTIPMETAETTPQEIAAVTISLLIPPVMAFLSLTLKDSTNRWPNIIVGIVFAGLGLGGAIDFLAKPSAYYAFLIPIGIVEVVFAALIVWYAWKSKQKT